MHQLLNDQCIKNINQLNYPVLLVDENNVPQFGNKKLLRLYSLTSKNTDSLQSIKIDNDTLKKKEYTLVNGDKKSTFSLNISKYSFENQNFFLISFFDISKSKKIQEEIALKKKMFEQLSEKLPEGIILFSENIIYTNPIFEKTLGFNGKELSRKKFEDLIDDSDKDLFLTSINKLNTFHKSNIEIELKLINKKNIQVWMRIKVSLIKDIDEILFLAVSINISRERTELEKLNQLAFKDTLTGIYNRRKFDELILMEYKRSKRYSRELCGIFFDIDHFKNVNDTYGHEVGDIVLKELSLLVQAHIRETDFFARWGGEEFILLLPETNIEQAFVSAEHLRNKIKQNNFPQVKTVTASFGLTQLKGQEQLKTFVKRLDNALYKAKKEGRNRSVIL